MEVTTAQLADLLSITARRVQDLENENIIEKIERNKWDASQCIEKYINYKIAAATENIGDRKHRINRGKSQKRKS